MEAFDRFVRERRKDLERIAWCTRKEYAYGDVVNEAWLMAATISARKCMPIDFLDDAFQQLLLSHLYQHLVRYTEVSVRHAVRLDHPRYGEEEHESAHPLMNTLASDDGDDPLTLLIATEAPPAHPSFANEHHSLASTYLVLLAHFNNRMYGVARYLLISTSHAYRCCAKARLLTTRQHALELSPPASMFTMKPWRKRRTRHAVRQLEFDFAEKLPLAMGADEP